jgi:hypothetical protein
MNSRPNERVAVALTFVLLGVAGYAPVRAQAVSFPTARYYNPGVQPAEHPIDISHLRLEVSFDPPRRTVRGRTTHIFSAIRERVDSIFFNAPGISITDARLDGREVAFRIESEGVTVYPRPPLSWDHTDSIAFTFQAQPRKGLYFIGWDDPAGKRRKQIWTQGQGVDNRYWFPSYDLPNDKFTTETIVTVDSGLSVLSNGADLGHHNNPDGTVTWHYRMSHPHANYLVMLAIGEYAVDRRASASGVPVDCWYYPDRFGRVASTYQFAADMVDFVADRTGVPYPWESYSSVPVEDYLYGAMENTTATVYGDFLFVDARGYHDRNFIGVNAHELTHQWFGDFVTARSGKDTWLQESFATFYAKLFQRKIFGEDWYEWERREEQKTALAASEKNRLPIVHPSAGAARVYQKGSAVLDMMATVFGEAAYRRVIRSYLTNHAYGNVETNDLYQAFQDVLGLSPAWFFEEWLYRGGEPRYRVTFEESETAGPASRRSVFTVEQTHELDELVRLFTMPITFEVHYDDGTYDRMTETVSRQTERVVIPNPRDKTVAYALFDPAGTILKKVDFEKPYAMLNAQALHARHMIDRYDAIVAMRSIPADRKRDLLFQLYRGNRFQGIRCEIVAQLCNDDHPGSRALLDEATKDPADEVRASLLQYLSAIPAGLQKSAERLLLDSSYATAAMALTKLCSLFPADAQRYLEMTRGVEGIGNQVSVAWHEISAARGDSSSLETLVAMAGVSYDFRTRMYALQALRRLDYCPDALMPGLFGAMTHFNGRLRGPAQEVGGYFMQQSGCRSRMLAYYSRTSWSDAEREFLKGVILP